MQDGKRVRRSLRTTDERIAITLLNEMLVTGETEPPRAPLTVREAIQAFYSEQRARGLAEATLRTYRKFLDREPGKNPERFSPSLVMFADRRGITYLKDLDAGLVAEFRQQWKTSGWTTLKQSEKLKSFFRACTDMALIAENPASKLRPPTDGASAIIALTDDQLKALMEKCATEFQRTFLLTLRYSGLAPVDAIRLMPEHLDGNHLRLRRAKIKNKPSGWVKVLLPDMLVERLKSLSVYASGHYFWNRQGESQHESATKNMRRLFGPVFRAANIVLRDEDGMLVQDRHGKPIYGHLYQVRHTFAREQLESGTSLERLSELMGNSVKVIEKHYKHWMESRQVPLDEAVKKSWKQSDLDLYRLKPGHAVSP
jgi:site-specific recombinase XerD